MKEQYTEIGGLETRYVSAGERGPALILLHGLGASLETWWFSVDELGCDHRVYAPDIIYFGKSAKPARTPTHIEFVNFVLGFMDKFDLERAVLIGNSMGGTIAAKTAMLHPERVTSLVLVDAAGFGPELAWWLRLRSFINLRPSGKPAPWMVRLGLERIFEDPSRLPDELVERLIEMDQNPEGQVAAHRVLSIGVDWRGIKPLMLQEIRDAADQIRVPTLIIWGKQDRVVPVKHAQVAQAKIPQARLHVFDNCGHTPQLEFPEEFNTLVREFVRETNGHS